MGDEIKDANKGTVYEVTDSGTGTNMQVGKNNYMVVGDGGAIPTFGPAPERNSSDVDDRTDRFTVKKLGIGGNLQVGPQNVMAVSTRRPNTAQAQSNEEEETQKNCYRMDAEPRGLCYIFNNKEFKPGEEKRIGTDQDKSALEIVFTKLKFDVEVFPNKTASEMDSEVKDLAEKHVCREHNCVVVIFLNHGDEGNVKGVDNNTLEINKLTSYFRVCPALANKPKLFFFECCRGPVFPKAVRVWGDTMIDQESGTEKEMLISPEADFYFGYATVLGTQEMRNVEYGTWYIQSLVEVLREYVDRPVDAPREHFESLMIEVRRRVNAHEAERDDDDSIIKQTSVSESSLLKKLYL